MLTEIIITRIINEGPISFRDFMEMALYYPQFGYYTSRSEKIGADGDYYTCPHFTTLFSAMLAKQIEEMWQLMGKEEFTVAEYGAGTGILCRDILDRLKENSEFYNRLHYCIIEKSMAMREKQQAILDEKISWLDSINDIEGFTGCILSNELLDNFSVHRVVMMDELMEVFVDYNNGFTELFLPAANEIKHYLRQLNVTLPKGYRTEVNLDALGWINEVGNALGKGFVLTIDYGYPSSELYSTKRCNGTLVCYAKHKVNYDPYSCIGMQDITAHVNFSALRHWGTNSGLEYCGFTNQADFLHALGLADHLRKMEKGRDGSLHNTDKAYFFHTLMTDMGNKFKILIQQKGIKDPMLSGLQFTQQLL